MSKVYWFGIDSDSCVFDEKFESVEEFFEMFGKDVCEVFLDEYGCEIVKSVDVSGFELDEEMMREMGRCVSVCDEMMKDSEMVLVNYGVDCDSSWLVLSKSEYEKLIEMSENEMVRLFVE